MAAACSSRQAAPTLDQWPDTFIYKPAVDKNHQHSNKPAVQPLWITRGTVGGLYERTQQLWAALCAARPGIQVQYM